MDLNNISILNIMPPNLAADRNVKMLAESFDEVLQKIISKIPDVGIIPNLVFNRIVNETLIDLLAWQFHVDFYEPNFPIEIKLELIKKSLDWHFRKGTPSVVEEIIETVFLKAIIQEWYEYGGYPYRFRIATDEQIPDEDTRNRLYRAINTVKNTRSFLDELTQLVYFIDETIVNEDCLMTLQTEFVDDLSKEGKIFHNGRILRDGKTIFSTELKVITFFRNGKYIRNSSAFHAAIFQKCPASNIIMLPLVHGDSGMRDRFSLTVGFPVSFFKDNVSVCDTIKIWYKKHHFRNGVYFRNSNIQHDSMLLIPLE